MKTEMYIKRSDAEHAAMMNGNYINKKGKVDDRMSFDYNEMKELWSGECAAYQEFDDDGQVIGLYGYWEED